MVKAPTQTVGYNGYPAVRISGEAAPATLPAMHRRDGAPVAQLPAGFGYEWTGPVAAEIQSGSPGAAPDCALLPARLPVPGRAL